MDDKDKNAVEKLIDKINDVVEGIMTTTADAIDHVMEPKPLKPGDKVFLVPMAGAGADPLMTPAPMMPVAIPKKEGCEAPTTPSSLAADRPWIW